MPSDRKPRADSVLKNLPPDQQDEIVEHARAHTTRATSQWLAERGVKISHPEISHFLHWHAEQARELADQATAEALLEQMLAQNPRLTPRELCALGQRRFALQAIRKEDLRGFVALQKIALDREKYEFAASEITLAQVPELKTIATDSTLTFEQKIDQIRHQLFGEAAAPTTPPHGEIQTPHPPPPAP